MSIVNLSAPWVEHYRKLQTMFKDDPNVSVVYDEETTTCHLYVNGDKRAEALTKLVKASVAIGDNTMLVVVEEVDKDVPIVRPYYQALPSRVSYCDDIHWEAFRTNPALNTIEYAYGPGGAKFTYVIFNPEVVQYFNDNISDYNGLKSTLYEDIARDIFIGEFGVFYCTDKVRPDPGKEDY